MSKNHTRMVLVTYAMSKCLSERRCIGRKSLKAFASLTANINFFYVCQLNAPLLQKSDTF